MKKYLILLFVLTGCLTDKKAERITNDYLATHPIELADKCAKAFPVQPIEYKPGKVIIDTIYYGGSLISTPDLLTPFNHLEISKGIDTANIDSVRYESFKSGYQIGQQVTIDSCNSYYKNHPIIVKYHQTDTLIKRDSAGEASLRYQLTETQILNKNLQDKYDVQSSDLKKAKHKNLIYILIIIGLGAFTIFKSKIISFISGGWSKLVSKL